MKLILRICLFLMLGTSFAFPAVAESNFYGIASVGHSKIKGKVREPKKREYDVLGQKFTLTTSARGDGTSTVQQVGLGYNFSRYWAAEFSYWDGFEAEIKWEATLQSGSKQAKLTARQHAKMHGFEVSGLFKWPVTERFQLIARLGGFFGDEQERVFSPLLPEGYSITTKEQKKWLPVAGIGVLYQLTPRASIALEARGVNSRFVLTSVGWRYVF